jgi:hypothetical protein
MGPSRTTTPVKPAPGIPVGSCGLPPSFVHLVVHCCSRSMSGQRLDGAPPWRVESLRPRGPRSEPGYAVLVHPRLSAPSAPLAGTGRFRRLPAYTPCLRCAGAPRRPASGSGLQLAIPSWHVALYDPGDLADCTCPVLRQRHGLRLEPKDSALPTSHNPLPVGLGFRGYTGSLPLRPARLLASLADLTGLFPATEAFTSRLPTGRSPFLLLDITTAATGPTAGGTRTHWNSSLPRCTGSCRAAITNGPRCGRGWQETPNRTT